MDIDTILNTYAPADTTSAVQASFVPWGIIRAQGTDTVKFLQGQLTQDVALMGLSEARLAAWCSAKGRMLASFIVVKNTHDDILLLCSTDVLAATLKRLQMFVLRAQCKLSDASAAFTLRGLAGAFALPYTNGVSPDTNSAENAIKNRAAKAIYTMATSLSVTREGENTGIDLPPGYHAGLPIPRALVLTPAASGQNTSSTPALSHDQALWQYLEVTSGIARITQPVVDAFVPQMLNYESIGGVNFKKGCYPGQEVVARSQFRGTLKRRAYVVHADVPLAVGAEVFHSSDAEQPCGTVASAAPSPSPEAGFAAIVSMQVAASATGQLTLGSAQGAPLQLQALPYALLADI